MKNTEQTASLANHYKCKEGGISYQGELQGCCKKTYLLAIAILGLQEQGGI